MQPADLTFALGQPPEKAIEYFKSKGYAIGWDWNDVWQEAQAKAFTVAKVTRLDILQDIRGALQSSLDDGTTFRDFQKELTPLLKSKGWWGKTVFVDSQGNAEMAQLGSPRRLQTIYRTNMQTSFMAGRYQALMENVADRPYWQYVAVMDERTRPSHARLNGLVFRYDDPFWLYFFPPCGFNCRCRVRALSAKNLHDRAISVRDSQGHLSEVMRPVSKRTGEVAPVTVYTDHRTKKLISPDVGWNYNPGRAAWQPDLNAYDFPIARQYVQGSVTGPDFARFVAGAGKIEGEFPVAVLAPAEKEILGAKAQQVLLSADTLAKQTAAHPEIALGDYQKLQTIMDAGEVYRQGDQRLVFIKLDDVWYRAVVKVTAAGDEIYLVSLIRTGEREIARARKQLEKLK